MRRSNPRFRAVPSRSAADVAGAPALRPGPWIVLLSLLTMTACHSGARAVHGESRFAGSAPSIQELGRVVLESLARGDTATLERFRLSEHEHNDVVWPELPASAPEVNFPLDYAWSNIQRRNRRALRRQFPRFTGRAPEFERVECRGDPEAFRTFVVHTDCWVVFKPQGARKPLELQVFKDVLERDGGYKVFRYSDEPPRLHGREKG